jgi:hypothetical protein
MTLVELKTCITTGALPNEFLVLVSKDSSFLAKQYIQAIGKLAPGGLTKISSIYEPQQSSFSLLVAPEDTVNVLYTDTFDERAENYGQFENVIVVCEQIEKSLVKVLENFTIKLPKLEDWQIYDYAKTICPGVDEDDLMWLIKASEGSIERVLNELDKVALFRKEDQKAVFASIRFDPQSDLYKADLFNIINALVLGNMPVLFDFLKHENGAFDAVVLANRAFNSLKNIVIVSQNRELSADACGVSYGQWKFIRDNYHNLNIEAVKRKLKFLSNFDLDLKTSKLDMTKRDMLNYLITNISYKITR